MERDHGIYNVEWLTFRRDAEDSRRWAGGTTAASSGATSASRTGRWATRSTSTTGRRGSSGVHVLEHPGGGLAPWNISAHRLGESDGSVLVDGQPLIFFHHHAPASLPARCGRTVRRHDA